MKNYQKYVDVVGNWLSTNAEVFRLNEEMLNKALEQGGRRFLKIGFALGAMGEHWAVQGLLGGDQDCRGALISRGLGYRYLEVLLVDAAMKAQRFPNLPGASQLSPTNHYDLMGNMLSATLAVGDRERSRVLGDVIRESKSKVSDDVMATAYACQFVECLNEVASGNVDVADAAARCGDGYEDIFLNWVSGDLSGALERLAARHLRNILGTKRRSGEFRGRPFDLVPFELLAVGRVRREMGLSTEYPDNRMFWMRDLIEDSVKIEFDYLCYRVDDMVRKELGVGLLGKWEVGN